MGELGQIDVGKATNANVLQSSGSIEQTEDNPDFWVFQKKVASKSLWKRIIGAIIGIVGTAGVAVGGIFTIKVGVAAVIGTLAGLVGASAAPFVLVGMGALCIAAIVTGIVLFAKNSRENVYIRELKNLLQSKDVNNKKRAISYLNEMIAKDENTIEYINAAIRFLDENVEILGSCLGTEDNGLNNNMTNFLTEVSKNKCEKTKYAVEKTIVDCLSSTDNVKNDNVTKILTEMLKNENDSTKSLACEIIKLKGFSETIQGFLKSSNNKLKASTIDLLTEMLKNNEMQATVDGIVKGCIKSDNAQSMTNTIALLTEILKNKNTQASAEGFIKNFSEKIGNWMKSGNNELKANTIRLLAEMLKSKSTDLANITKKIITGEDFIIEGQSFADIIKGWLRSGDDRLKINIVELLNEMLVGSDEELKNKSKEILKSDVLNTKGMLNIFLNDKGKVNEEAISLLSPMCKDEEIKNTMSDLIGKDLVEKLEKQENEVKSDDVVNVLYENVIVKGIFSEGNKKHIIDLLKNEDGLHNVDINFDENGQITAIEKTKLNSFFKDGKLNLEALKAQAITDISRELRLIEVGKNTTYVEGEIDNGKGGVKKEQSLNKFFEDAKISKDAKDLIYKFPGQSAFGTRALLVIGGAQHLGGALIFDDTIGSKLNSCGITVNTDGSVEVQMRRIGIISTGPLNLPMVIEEVHTFKINKGEDTYKTTNAKITVYKLESTSIQLRLKKI